MAAFGTAIGVDGNTVSRWEKGQAEPRDASFIRMIELFDLEPDYFFPDEEREEHSEPVPIREVTPPRKRQGRPSNRYAGSAGKSEAAQTLLNIFNGLSGEEQLSVIGYAECIAGDKKEQPSEAKQKSQPPGVKLIKYNEVVNRHGRKN